MSAGRNSFATCAFRFLLRQTSMNATSIGASALHDSSVTSPMWSWTRSGYGATAFSSMCTKLSPAW